MVGPPASRYPLFVREPSLVVGDPCVLLPITERRSREAFIWSRPARQGNYPPVGHRGHRANQRGWPGCRRGSSVQRPDSEDWSPSGGRRCDQRLRLGPRLIEYLGTKPEVVSRFRAPSPGTTLGWPGCFAPRSPRRLGSLRSSLVHRGEWPLGRLTGDPEVGPNPTLGSIDVSRYLCGAPYSSWAPDDRRVGGAWSRESHCRDEADGDILDAWA